MNRRRNDKSKRFRASDVVARRNVYLLIDGYNLMHVTRFKPVRSDDGELRRCREGLLSLLAEQLDEKQFCNITIVFDSSQAPKHLADQLRWQHLDVVFARDENTADDLIAKLVQRHAHPKQLIVISSDHRVQNAGSRRKATVIDSEEWFDAVLDHLPEEGDLGTEADLGAVGEELKMDPNELSDFIAEMNRAPAEKQNPGMKRQEDELENPFPDGYFDDLDES